MNVEVLLTEHEEQVAPKRPHLSHSQVNRYLLCPEQYRLYYVERMKAKTPAATLVFGQVIHHALAVLFEKHGDPVGHFQQTWTTIRNVPLKYGERDSWEKLNATGERLLQKFVEDELPKIGTVTAVEKPFELAITDLDLPLFGIIDLVADVAAERTIVDFKTASAAYDPHEVVLSDQLSAYRMAEPSADKLALCVLVKTKEPRIAWHTTTRSGMQLSEYLTKVGYVAHEIKAGRFYKRPGFWCAWCDFLPLCVGDMIKVRETLVKAAYVQRQLFLSSDDN